MNPEMDLRNQESFVVAWIVTTKPGAHDTLGSGNPGWLSTTTKGCLTGRTEATGPNRCRWGSIHIIYIYTPIILLDDHYIRSPFDILVIYNNIYIYIPGWWFETFFPNSWDDDPIWLIFFRGVETTNQYISIWTLILAILLCIQYKHIMFFPYIYIYIISPRTFPGAIHCQAPGRRLGHALQELWLPGGRRENDGKTMDFNGFIVKNMDLSM